MEGHATESELQRVKELQRLDPALAPPGELLDLACLYIEPLHDESRALEVLEGILQRDPEQATARLWLAFCCIHHLMDRAALRRAVEVLAPLNSRRDDDGAGALMLTAEARRDLKDVSPEEEAALLARSVANAPTWVHNRARLARAYAALGRVDDAIREMAQALANIREPNPNWGPARDVFEVYLTGRSSARTYLEEELAVLQKQSGGFTRT